MSRFTSRFFVLGLIRKSTEISVSEHFDSLISASTPKNVTSAHIHHFEKTHVSECRLAHWSVRFVKIENKIK